MFNFLKNPKPPQKTISIPEVKVKAGVRFYLNDHKNGKQVTVSVKPCVFDIVAVASMIFATHQLPLVITSCMDGKHKVGSKHYTGEAVDLRIRHIPNHQTTVAIGKVIAAALGPDYDVVLESDHFHIEYDPKGKNT